MLKEIFLACAFVVIIASIAERIFAFFDDAREPRRVYATIPLIGHPLGLWRHGFKYHEILANRAAAEIFTVGILNFKIYITSSTRVISIVQKTKTLSSTPFLRVENRIHAGVSEDAHARFDGELLERFRFATKQAFAAGPSLDDLAIRIGREAIKAVTKLSEQKDVFLLAWTKHWAVQITSGVFFGSEHPFLDPEIVEAMWLWEEYKPGHQVGFDPFSRGYSARRKVFGAFKKYLGASLDDAAGIIKNRQEVLQEGGIGHDDIAQMQSFFSGWDHELQNIFSNANTMRLDAYHNISPSLHWVIYEIFSRPRLLMELRAELTCKAIRQTDKGAIIDIAALKLECQLLRSVFEETQRMRHEHATSRMVAEDTVLDGFLLKKGNILQMPAVPIHQNQDIWGQDASTFNPYRFMPAKDGGFKAKIPPSAFLSWGLQPFACPARQFVAMEILTIVAVMMIMIDMAPASGEEWDTRPALRSLEKPTMARPRKDVRIAVTPRQDAPLQLSVMVGQDKTRFTLASG